MSFKKQFDNDTMENSHLLAGFALYLPVPVLTRELSVTNTF